MGKQEKRPTIYEPRDEKKHEHEAKKRPASSDCAVCANRYSPLCELCTVVVAPDGSAADAKYCIALETVLPLFNMGELPPRGEACAEMIEKYLKARYPIPSALVMEYNNHVDRKRKSG